MDYNIIQMNENTWRIEDGGVRFFLLTGTEKALLIDSGMMIQNAKEIAESLTDLPIELLNTHADRDHICSNEEFASFYMHPAEEPLYRRSGKPGTIIPVQEGDTIDLVPGRELPYIVAHGMDATGKVAHNHIAHIGLQHTLGGVGGHEFAQGADDGVLHLLPVAGGW